MLPMQVNSLPASISPALVAKTGARVHDAASSERVKSMAKEFEATFLSMLLKEMRQTLDEDGGLFPGDTGDVQGGLFDMFMGQHLADAGGIGVAAYLQRQMQTAEAAKPVTSTDATTPAARSAHPVVPGATLR